MSFAVAADSYDRFMGRYSRPLAPLFADFAGVSAEQRVLDVGCGTGALTDVLIGTVGKSRVSAIDPSESFLEAIGRRHPGIEVRRGFADDLPFDDAGFDATLAQLVVHFMSDPVGGLKEMRRVTASGGTVAACVWDHAGGAGPLAMFWTAVATFDPAHHGEADLPGTRRGHLGELFEQAGLDEIIESELIVEATHPSFEDWWEPFTFGVGPAGSYVAGLSESDRDALRQRCQEMFGTELLVVRASAWAARGQAPK